MVRRGLRRYHDTSNDIRIASSSARHGVRLSRRGVVPEAAARGSCSPCRHAARREWVYTGRVFGAEEALAGGLVSRVVPPDALMETALALHARSPTTRPRSLWRWPADDVEAPGRRPSDGRAPPRLARYGLEGRSADAPKASPPSSRAPAALSLRPSQDMPPFYPWWSERSFK